MLNRPYRNLLPTVKWMPAASGELWELPCRNTMRSFWLRR